MRKIIPVLVIGFLVATKAFSAEPPRLGEFIEHELTSIEETFETADKQVMAAGETTESWLFRRIMLRLRPYVTFTAGIAKISVIPDVEIVWDRTLPEGMKPYTPN